MFIKLQSICMQWPFNGNLIAIKQLSAVDAIAEMQRPVAVVLQRPIAARQTPGNEKV